MGEPGTGTAGWTPRTRVADRVRPPASKSLAIRDLLAAALARGTTRIEGLSDADDVRAALAVASSVAVVEREGADATVRGVPPAEGGWRPAGALQVGESGTLARLATAALALCGAPGERFRVDAAGTLLRRESPPLLDALAAAGAGVVPLADDGRRGWPLAVTPAPPPDAVVLDRPTSSQEASGLALALAAHDGERELRVRGALPSRPYYALTLGVLRRFGARVEPRPSEDGEALSVRGALVAPDAPLVVESDASAAAVALAAGCLAGGALVAEGVGAGSPQGDVRIIEHLAAFGCEASAGADELRASGAPTRGAEVDLEGEPDLAPVLAAVAGVVALRGLGPSRLTGLGTLDGKESPRLTVLAGALRAVGCAVEAAADSLTVAAGPRTRGPLVLDPRGDHRMAFAFALLGLERDELGVSDPGCVAKSWPGFWTDLAAR